MGDVDTALVEDLSAAQLRAMAFGGARGGYAPQAVDQEIARRHRLACLAERAGDDPQRSRQIRALSRAVVGRVDRPHGQRFRRPSAPMTLGYRIDDVDALLDALGRAMAGGQPLRTEQLRSAVLPGALGTRAYEPHQVDAFLDAVVELFIEFGD